VDFFVHPEKDPGVLGNAHEFLLPFVRTHFHTLVFLDREGCGREELTKTELETQIENNLKKTGWGDRGQVIVLDPELEIWVWSDSPHVDHELGWGKRQPDLRTWLRNKGFLTEGEEKPFRPKEALESVLRSVKRPRSSALYQALARKVSLEKCSDPAFLKLKSVLREWFPQT
jgi:hypothetical protein